MDEDKIHDSTVSIFDGDPGNENGEMSNEGTVEGLSFDKEVMRDVWSSLSRMEVDLAFTSEKLVNMNQLMMQLAERESNFEAFASGRGDKLGDSTAKALEFDLLSGVFDSEVKVMDKFVSSLQNEINNAGNIISSHTNLGDLLSELEGKLHDTEESINQSREQVSDLMMQSAKFQRMLPSSNGNKTSTNKDVVISEDGDSLSTTAKLEMQTSAQQQHILRMLEKSLARELDLDKKLTECTHALDEMKFRLCSSEQEVLSLEEETVEVYAQFLEADNASAILLGISKELISQLQSCQLNISSAVQREGELNSRLQNCMQAAQQMEKTEEVLQKLVEESNLEALVLKERVNSLEEELKTSEFQLLIGNASNVEQINVLQAKIVEYESRAAKAEAECNLLTETNKELNEEVDLMKSTCIPSERVDSLEKQLVETNNQLQQAMATVEASQENQSMLYTTINDMDNLIQKLKSKASEANARADDAEDKCIILSENNAELNEELHFLRGKLETLEASLLQAEEIKLATAKDISIQTKMITELVMQLAIERERLHKQIYLLMNENKAFANKVDSANNAASNSKCETGEGKDDEGEDIDTTKVKSSKDNQNGECETDSQDVNSKMDTVRNIDPSLKYLLSAIVVVLLAILLVCMFQPESCPV